MMLEQVISTYTVELHIAYLDVAIQGQSFLTRKLEAVHWIGASGKLALGPREPSHSSTHRGCLLYDSARCARYNLTVLKGCSFAAKTSSVWFHSNFKRLVRIPLLVGPRSEIHGSGINQCPTEFLLHTRTQNHPLRLSGAESHANGKGKFRQILWLFCLGLLFCQNKQAKVYATYLSNHFPEQFLGESQLKTGGARDNVRTTIQTSLTDRRKAFDDLDAPLSRLHTDSNFPR